MDYISIKISENYQLYKPPQGRFFLWCRQRDSNSRPTDYKSTALIKYYLYKSMC